MKLRAVSGTILMVLLVGMLTLVFNIQAVKSDWAWTETVYITADGSVVPDTAPISSVDNITYKLTDNIVGDVPKLSSAIVVERDNTVVDGVGYSIQGTGNGTGIMLDGRSNVTIKNTEIKSFFRGIELYWSSNSTITGNNITENGWGGIRLYWSSSNAISGNAITNNGYGIRLVGSNNSVSRNSIENNSDGIVLEYSSSNGVSENNITNNSDHGILLRDSFNNTLSGNEMNGSRYNFGVNGYKLHHFLHSVDDLNRVDGKPVYYRVNLHGAVVPSDGGYVALVNCTGITVRNLNLTNNGQGVLLAFTTNSTITKNNITNNEDGLYLHESSNITISGNKIRNNEDGLYLHESSNNVLNENNLTENNGYGIRLYWSSSNAISGNAITNNGYGIRLVGSNNSVSRNSIENNSDGIVLEYSSSNGVSENNITNNSDHGICLRDSSDITVSENKITNNVRGIYLRESPNNTLRNNDAGNNKYNFGVYGSLLLQFIQNIDDSNTVDDKPIYYWVSRRDIAVPLDVGYLALVNCTGITVRNLNLTNNGQGVLLAFTTNSTITKNNITNNEDGLYLHESSNITISGNKIRNNYDGICFSGSSNSTITGNNITANNDDGIYLRDSSDITVSENKITNNLFGICFSGSSNSTITGNNITANNGEGIHLYGNSNYNTISGNTITNDYANGVGCFGSNNTISGNTITNNVNGIFCSGSNNTISGNTITNNDYGIYPGSNNTICHNNFIGNPQQVKISGHSNFWDNGYPSGGNYWSDYVYKDEFSGPSQDQPGSDGIGDKPYIIDGNNTDRYPLTTPPILYEHDLVVSLWAPNSIIIGTSTTLKATVYNLGLNNENNVELKLLINDIVVGSEVILELASGSFSTFNYSWTPTVESIYNVTASVTHVSGELTTVNNVISIMVNVYTPPTGPTEMFLSPSESHAFVGSIITIDVMVADVEDLYCWQVQLYFDPTVLNFTVALYPPYHVFAGKTIIPVSPFLGSDENGAYVTYGCSLFSNELTFSGSGTLCRMNFTGMAEGSSALSFSGTGPGGATFLLNSTLADIAFEVADGLVVVEELEGDLNLDGRVDMRDISLAAAAFGSYSGHPRWNPIVDINEDNKVDMRDLATIARNFGKTV